MSADTLLLKERPEGEVGTVLPFQSSVRRTAVRNEQGIWVQSAQSGSWFTVASNRSIESFTTGPVTPAAHREDRWNAAEWNQEAAENAHRYRAREAHLDWLEGYDAAEDGR